MIHQQLWHGLATTDLMTQVGGKICGQGHNTMDSVKGSDVSDKVKWQCGRPCRESLPVRHGTFSSDLIQNCLLQQKYNSYSNGCMKY